MKEIFRNKKLVIITSIFLVMVIGATGYWQYRNTAFVEASGLVSIDIRQGLQKTPGDEIASERTENAKKYSLGKGRYGLDISMGAIHYKDNYANSSEPWKDIDLTFDNGRITKAPYILSVNQDDKSLTATDKKTGKTTTLKLTKIGSQDMANIKTNTPKISKGIIQWDNVVPDLDLAVYAENTRVSFNWVVKSDKAPHEVEFEINDGGIPITYKGVDVDGKAVVVTTQKNGNKVVETIQKGGRYPKTINPTVDFQVGANTDSVGCILDGTFYINGPYNPVIGNAYSVTKCGLAARWLNVNIPAGATITASYISVRAMTSNSTTTVNSRITGDKEANPATFSDSANWRNRRGTLVGGANNNYITSAQVVWDNISSWTADTWYNSPEIKTVVQEIVNQGGWASGNALALFWDDHDGRGDQTDGDARMMYGYIDGAASAPKLYVTYDTNSISNTPTSYNLGVVAPNATISTGLDYFTVTNNSGSAVNITIGGTDITGGTTWTLSDTATPGVGIAGIKAGLNGGAYNIIVKKTPPFNILKSNLAPSSSQSWGLQLLAPTNYTDSVQKAGTVTLTATVP